MRQALEAVRFVTDDEAVQERVLRETLCRVSAMDFELSPPEMGYEIHRLIREYTGCRDPYAAVKQVSNTFALELLPELEQRVHNADDPLEMAARYAVAGNVIDFGVSVHMDHDHYMNVIRRAERTPFDGETFDHFRGKLKDADQILYLVDNAGEIVFDRLFIEQMPMERITVAVKGGPILNDATIKDAAAAGLTERVNVVETGSDAPGTMLNYCTDEFRTRFDRADMVIAKGQANYETLSRQSRDVFFMLKIKCPVIGRDMGEPLGHFVLRNPH
jgi:hypothetical protein